MNEHYPFVNPPLPYTYDALEPYVNIQTLYQHHDRILQQYVTNLNNILKDYPELHIYPLQSLEILEQSKTFLMNIKSMPCLYLVLAMLGWLQILMANYEL